MLCLHAIVVYRRFELQIVTYSNCICNYALYIVKSQKSAPPTQAGTRQNPMPFLYPKAFEQKKSNPFSRNTSFIFVKEHVHKTNNN